MIMFSRLLLRHHAALPLAAFSSFRAAFGAPLPRAQALPRARAEPCLLCVQMALLQHREEPWRRRGWGGKSETRKPRIESRAAASRVRARAHARARAHFCGPCVSLRVRARARVRVFVLVSVSASILRSDAVCGSSSAYHRL